MVACACLQVGHPRSFNFFILVNADDEDKLALHTERMMWDYIRSAPPSAERYVGPYWDKYHVGFVGGAGAAPSNDVYVSQGRTMVPEAEIGNVAPRRPWAFECPYSTVVQPNRAEENPNCNSGTRPRCNSGPTGITNAQCRSMSLWSYSQRDRVSDVRVSYRNANYSWIQAVWMWKNPRNHWPKQWDIGRMAFPTHVGDVGKHVIHWMWRGYRDCIDVDILPLSTPVANTSGAMYGYKASTVDEWIRIDHAQIPKGRYRPFTHSKSCCTCNRGWPRYAFMTCFLIPPEGVVINHPRGGGDWSRSEALRRCKARCTATSSRNCQGVQVVPLTLPPGVLFNTTEDHNVPWGRGDCVAAGTRGTRCLDPASAPAGAMVCYPVDFDMFPAPEISQKWHVAADDPRDEAFYSTLYLRTEAWRFDGPTLNDACPGGVCPGAGPAPPTTSAAHWRVGDRCLSCSDAQALHATSGDATVLPDWTLSQTCELCNRPTVEVYARRRRPHLAPSGVAVRRRLRRASRLAWRRGQASDAPSPSAAWSCTTRSMRPRCMPGCTARPASACAPTGWLALGFASVPGAMVGATAVLGNAASGEVALYALVSRDAMNPAAAATRLPPAQQALKPSASSIEAESGGLTLSFALEDTTTLQTFGAATLLYASGPTAAAAALAYHSAARGANSAPLVRAAPPLASSPPPPQPATADESPPPSDWPQAPPPPPTPPLSVEAPGGGGQLLLGLPLNTVAGVGGGVVAVAVVACALVAVCRCRRRRKASAREDAVANGGRTAAEASVGPPARARQTPSQKEKKYQEFEADVVSMSSTRHLDVVGVEMSWDLHVKPAAPPPPSSGPKPLPPRLKVEWMAVEDDDGQTYYYNSTTGESTWDRPAALGGAGGPPPPPPPPPPPW